MNCRVHLESQQISVCDKSIKKDVAKSSAGKQCCRPGDKRCIRRGPSVPSRMCIRTGCLQTRYLLLQIWFRRWQMRRSCSCVVAFGNSEYRVISGSFRRCFHWIVVFYERDLFQSMSTFTSCWMCDDLFKVWIDRNFDYIWMSHAPKFWNWKFQFKLIFNRNFQFYFEFVQNPRGCSELLSGHEENWIHAHPSRSLETQFWELTRTEVVLSAHCFIEGCLNRW
jgi:hypothetical protein